MKNALTVIVTAISGSVVLLDYFFRVNWLSSSAKEFLSWSVLLAAFSTALGGANIVKVHLGAFRDRNPRPKRALSLVVIASMLVWFAVGVSQGTSSPIYKFIWDSVYGSLSSSMFALNAFFIASAAYRSFRLRSIEGAILMAAACTVMLGRTGIGEAISVRLPLLADWLMKVPNTAGMRGITIGGALGAITVSMRVILGMERGASAFRE